MSEPGFHVGEATKMRLAGNPGATAQVPAATDAGAPTIGVFDSGVGGLTVLRELRRQLPHARYLYLGDTARLPYGSKSRATIARYAVESARFLVEQGAEYLVIACNTASALALDEIRSAVSVPVLGVIETGAAAARQNSISGDVLVIATTATVASNAYSKSLEVLGLRSLEKACPLLVPLVEEGWTTHPVTREVLRIYLAELTAEATDSGLKPDALVLGCTHYPLLRAEIEAIVSPSISVIDSAQVTATAAASAIGRPEYASNAHPYIRFYATDGVDRFRKLGSRFLAEPIDKIGLVNLGG